MTQYKVIGAACYVSVPGVGAVLLYRDAPVPDSAEDLDLLEADGFIAAVVDGEVGGHPSDLPADYVPPAAVVAEGATADAGDDPDGAGPMPAKSASRADWDAYAKSEAGGSLTDDDVAAFSSKEDLQKHYGVS